MHEGTPDELSREVQRDQRASVMLVAVIEHFGGKPATKHRVRDLSPGGLRVDNVEGLRSGATVLVSVGALETVAAQVRWVRLGFAGLAFAKPINPDEARTKVAVEPSRIGERASTKPRTASAPATAGWTEDVQNPYRK
jgi:hypothetical protein